MIMIITLNYTDEVEHWNEKDSDLDEDFPEDCRYSPDPILFDEISEETLSQDDQAIIWWVIAFTCVFQTLHSISGTAISWLLKFLGTLLSFLGLYSSNIARVASAFPCTLYQRKVYLQNKVMLPSVCNYVACPSCHNLYKFKHCLERRPHTQVVARVCFHCESAGIKVPLLKQVVTRSGSSKFYPFLAAPNACLISSLQCLLSRPGFYNLCESWRHNFVPNCSYISDVYYGKIWNDFMKFESISFLEVPNSIGLMLNIDWFQPFKHRQYSIMERQDRQKFWTKRSSLGV